MFYGLGMEIFLILKSHMKAVTGQTIFQLTLYKGNDNIWIMITNVFVMFTSLGDVLTDHTAKD